jgi:hypothetical protein
MYAAVVTLASLALGQLNAADLPDRCPPNRLSIGDDSFGWDEMLKSKDAERTKKGKDLFIIDMVLDGDIRMQPLPVTMTFLRDTGFMEAREPVAEKIEKRIAERKQPALKERGNYAMLMVYVGDFERVIKVFGPAAKEHATFVKDANITFALANSYWRLHKFQEANQFARISYKLNDSLDSKWMLMLADVGINGEKWIEKHDDAEYTTKFVTEIFPAKDRSGIPFEQVAEKYGIHRWGGTGSVSFVDLDGDGWDELVQERKFFPFEIYKNDHGKFALVPEKKMGHDNCSMVVAAIGDFNNDSKPDIFRHCCNYDGAGPTVFLKNKGELTFEDITKEAGLSYEKGYGMVAAWADYDLDGFLDISVGDANNTTRLYRNTGKGTFTEVTEAAKVTTPGKKLGLFGTVGTSWGDLDDDGYPDLYVQGWGWKRLFMNNKDGTFKDVTAKSGLNTDQGIRGYTNQIFDYDNDGKLDLYTGQYVVSSGVKWGFAPICTCSNLLKKTGYMDREWKFASTIYKNNGNGTFTDMAAKTHFIPLGTMGANNADWDNDGDQDLVMGAGGPYFQQAEPYLFYENQGDGTFKLRTPFYDLSLWGKGHGAAFGDYDHDGNVDLYLNNGGATPGDIWPSQLLRNTGSQNHWFEVGFKGGPGTNSMGVGARVKVTAGGKTYLQELWSGSRFSATNTLRLHYGLGAAAKIEKVEIRWPNKKLGVTVLENLDADQAIEVNEATGKFTRLWAAPRSGNVAKTEGGPAAKTEAKAEPAKTPAPAKK